MNPLFSSTLTSSSSSDSSSFSSDLDSDSLVSEGSGSGFTSSVGVSGSFGSSSSTSACLTFISEISCAIKLLWAFTDLDKDSTSVFISVSSYFFSSFSSSLTSS